MGHNTREADWTIRDSEGEIIYQRMGEISQVKGNVFTMEFDDNFEIRPGDSIAIELI